MNGEGETMAFNILMEVLNELHQSHLEMVELANHKKQILIEGNVEELTKMMQLESSWVKYVGKLEEERIDATQQYVKDKGFAFEHVTLHDLTKMTTSAVEKQQLQEMLEKMNDVMNHLKQINERNSILIKQSLDYISNSFNIMTEGLTEEETVYSKPSTAYAKQSRSMFDSRA